MIRHLAHRARPSRRRIRAVAALPLLALALMPAGCAEPLLPPDADRSQFAGYDRARDQTVDPYREDEFGRRRPNLRARLLTRD